MEARTTLRMKRTFDASPSRLRRIHERGGDASLVARRAGLGDAGGDGRSARRRRRSGADAKPARGRRYGGGGRYTEIDPPNRLAFTWGWDDDEDRVEQLIEVDFVEADGATTITFTHSGLWDEESLPSFEDGWGKCFDNLERVLESS